MVVNDRIKIVSLDGMSDIEDVDVRLRTLIQCTENTIPGSRAFGLPRDYLDSNINDAANLFAVELQEKAERYIPDISIESVDIEYDLKGRFAGTINIERRASDD